MEGSVHVIQLNRQAGTQTPMFVVTWSPYSAHHQSGTIPTVKCVGVESLRYFLRDAVGLSEKSIRDWVKNLETEGEISIPNVILDSDDLKKIGLFD